MSDEERKPITSTRAQILIRVDDGVLNELCSFDLPIYAEEDLVEGDPDAIPGARLRLTVARADILKAVRELLAGLEELPEDAWVGANPG
jgi:hypothetical protein